LGLCAPSPSSSFFPLPFLLCKRGGCTRLRFLTSATSDWDSLWPLGIMFAVGFFLVLDDGSVLYLYRPLLCLMSEPNSPQLIPAEAYSVDVLKNPFSLRNPSLFTLILSWCSRQPSLSPPALWKLLVCLAFKSGDPCDALVSHSVHRLELPLLMEEYRCRRQVPSHAPWPR